MTKELKEAAKSSLPTYLNKGEPARGSENAGTDDIVLPRISLLQALSPQIDEGDAAYVPGAKQGDIINTLTGAIYGKEITIIPVFFRKVYIIWKDRAKGGGLNGIFDTKQDAMLALNALEPPTSDYEIIDTAEEFVLVVNADGTMDEAILSMSKTKMKCSRKLQSLIRLTTIDSFASMFTLKSIADQSDLGKFFNFDVASKGFVAEDVYKKAEAMYKDVSSNAARYKADASDGATEATADVGDGQQMPF